MIGIRSLYQALNESRKSSRQRATLAVTGDSPEAARLAKLLGAERSARKAEIVLSVSGSGQRTSVEISGPAVEDKRDISPREALADLPDEEVVSEIVPAIVDEVDSEHLVPLGRGYEAFRRPVSEELIRKNAWQNAMVGAIPVPGADLPVMTANQGRMVLNLAAVHGQEITLERARELIGVLGAGLALRGLGRQLVKILPVGGWAAAGAIGYAGTLAMGRAALLYFERGRQPESGELSDIRRRAQEEAKSFFSRLRRR